MIKEEVIFPIKVHKLKCTNWVNKKDRLLGLVDWDNPEYKNGFQISDYYENKRTGWPYTHDFFLILEEEFDKLLKHTDKDSLHITALWGQRYKEAQYMPTHTHGTTGYSAVVYVEFNKQEHFSTRFLAPYHSVDNHLDAFSPDVEEGDILVFPSFLLHDAPPFLSKQNRTIFSFNFFLK